MNKKKNQQLVAIGNKIRSQRIETGLSQEEFAVLAGLDRSYYGGVERGERNMSNNCDKVSRVIFTSYHKIPT